MYVACHIHIQRSPSDCTYIHREAQVMNSFSYSRFHFFYPRINDKSGHKLITNIVRLQKRAHTRVCVQSVWGAGAGHRWRASECPPHPQTHDSTRNAIYFWQTKIADGHLGRSLNTLRELYSACLHLPSSSSSSSTMVSSSPFPPPHTLSPSPSPCAIPPPRTLFTRLLVVHVTFIDFVLVLSFTVILALIFDSLVLHTHRFCL
jgi:hypothetical protein